MSGTVQGGRALVRGRLFGFPVHVDLSFLLIMALLGYYPGVTAQDMVLWLLITPVAVLAHELGHAVLARAAGAEPAIALAGFGGVTTYRPPRALSRSRSLGISLAGPVVGLVLGGALIAVQSAVGDGVDVDSALATGLRIGIWTCVGWSAFNLLPVLPLDGGQAMRELLPGAPAVRLRRAQAVSAVVAAVAAVIVYLTWQPFAAIFLALFAVTNGLALRAAPAGSPGVRAAGSPGVRLGGRSGLSGAGAAAAGPATSPEDAIVGLLLQGEPARAREVLAASSVPVDLAVHGAVLALTGDVPQGVALLRQERQRRPAETKVAGLLVATLALLHDWDGVIAAMQEEGSQQVPTAAVERATAEARAIGRGDVAGRLELLAQRPHG